ncbi:MAG: hypothetical protein R3Y59_04900, partial [bacterium]
MDDKLRSTLSKIKTLADKNPEFASELRKIVKVPSPAVSVSNDISENVLFLRQVLEISANVSINYEFIKSQRLKDQLIIDNLRMENSTLEYKQTCSEKDRYINFCLSAFHQIEAVVNYYFEQKYPNINDLISTVQLNTQDEAEGFRYKPSGKESDVSNIDISHKLNAIINILFTDKSDKFLKMNLGQLRRIRNMSVHRADNQSNDEKLNQFYQYNSID